MQPTKKLSAKTRVSAKRQRGREIRWYFVIRVLMGTFYITVPRHFSFAGQTVIITTCETT